MRGKLGLGVIYITLNSKIGNYNSLIGMSCICKTSSCLLTHYIHRSKAIYVSIVNTTSTSDNGEITSTWDDIVTQYLSVICCNIVFSDNIIN